MKKITFLFTCLALSLNMYSQQTISFETSEGYTVGDINNQNGWTTTGCGPGCFVENQMVSNALSTTGTNSLKIANEGDFGPQTNGPVIGGFYDFATPIDYTTATISYDILVTEQDGADFRFGLTGSDANDDLYYTLIIDFSYLGTVKVGNAAGDNLMDIGTWTPNTWYNVRAEVSGSAVTYYIDNAEVAQSVLLNNYNFESLRFVHDNYGGDAYMDNLRINDEDLSVKDFSNNAFTHSYNNTVKTLNLESSNMAMTSVEIYSILGQSVMTKSLNATSESIDVSSLTDGVYLAKVNINGNSKTVKFIKS